MADFKKGDKLTAAQMNALKKAATGPTRVTVSGDANVANTAGGLHINVGGGEDAKRSFARTVIITKSPVAADEHLTVKTIGYSKLPPVPCKEGASAGSYLCSIDTAGEEFAALPYYGKKAVDYKDYYWNTATPPNETTTFFEARRENGYWFLSAPVSGGGSLDLCLVHSPVATSNWDALPEIDFIRVIHMKANPTYGQVVGGVLDTKPYIWAGLGVDADGSSVVKCWPGTKHTYWKYFASTNQGYPPAPVANAVYMQTTFIAGVEYILPQVAIAASSPDPALPAGDC